MPYAPKLYRFAPKQQLVVPTRLLKALGGEKPGHKYSHRAPDGKGGFHYFYTNEKGHLVSPDHPEVGAEEHAAHAKQHHDAAMAAHKEGNVAEATRLMKISGAHAKAAAQHYKQRTKKIKIPKGPSADELETKVNDLAARVAAATKHKMPDKWEQPKHFGKPSVSPEVEAQIKKTPEAKKHLAHAKWMKQQLRTQAKAPGDHARIRDTVNGHYWAQMEKLYDRHANASKN